MNYFRIRSFRIYGKNHPRIPSCATLFCWEGYFQKLSKRGQGLTGFHLLEGVTEKDGGDFFQGLQFLHKK